MNKNKSNSFIRKGAVLPLLFCLACLVLFNWLFLDLFLKWSLEKTASKMYGAEINIQAVKTSLLNLSIEMKKIEFTDKKDVSQNAIEIGVIRFKTLWDAILRAKFVVDEMIVSDIRIQTKRSYRGYVDLASNKEEPSQILINTKKELSGNIFSDIAGFLTKDSKGFHLDENLRSKAKIEDLIKTIDERSSAMKVSLQNLSSAKDMNALRERFDKIDWKSLSNISKAPQTIKKIDSLKKDIDQEKKKYDELSLRFNKDINYFQTQRETIESDIKIDIANTKNKFKIPDINVASISKILFGQDMMSKIDMLANYHEKIKIYLPPKKSKEEIESSKPDYIKNPRGSGVNYTFPKEKSYPFIWIKKILVNSSNEQGSLEGKILNLTGQQALINMPTTTDFKASYKSKGYKSLDLNAIFDFRENSKTSFNLKLKDVDVTNKLFNRSEELNFAIAKAKSDISINLNLVDDQLDLDTFTNYRDIDYSYDAKSKLLKEFLASITKSTSEVWLKAKVPGSLTDLAFSMDSNLASSIKKTTDQIVKSQILDSQKNIEDSVKNTIKIKKEELNSKLSSIKNEYQSIIDSSKNKIDGLRNEIDQKRKNEEGKIQKGLRDSSKKLFKGFKL